MDDLQHQYRVMFDNMAQGAFYQLADGSPVDINSAALAMFGLSRETFMGRNGCDPGRLTAENGTEIPPRQHPAMVALHTGQPVRDFVAGFHNPQQQRFTWLNINAIPLFREGESTPYQVFVTMHDISEQKRINDIHLSRIHLMQFANTHPLEKLLVEALDEVERLTGSVIGFYHFYDHDNQAVLLKEWSTGTANLFCRAHDKGGHYGVEQAGVWIDCILKGEPVIHNDYASLPHRRGLPEGHAPVIRELVVPVKRNGRIVAILGVGNKAVDYNETDVQTVSLFADLTWDIAERKQAELMLLQASRQYEVLTNTAMDGYWLVDAKARILFANETSCRMHGYSLEEIAAKTLHDLEAVENDAETLAHVALIRERGYDRFETRHYTKGGGVIDVEMSVSYLPENGSFLAFTRDITEQKQMQGDLLRSKNELKLANELLEHRVSQRTADLQAAIREQESFSYSVSHDLRAPLRHINSFSSILKEEYWSILPTQACDYLDRIRGASGRMGALIDHLLELSRVTRAEIRVGEVDLSELVAATLRMFEETEPHRKVEQRVQPGIVALGDHHLLSQLLENLLGNAWKYTSRKTPARIEFGTTLVSGEQACFVRDNGAGFDMRYKENLFKAFERLHGCDFEGIGIGLATAQRIIQRHGGKIWAEGEVDRGAAFYFTLPAGP
ncbi:MAG: hypothetical protein A2075_00375 [Geobacteraceae bacterium GWC2_58_44]|nr:MAG: hypothetical protein A2075_00375 [Geobacteraceae bacterium GWC2_58_44]